MEDAAKQFQDDSKMGSGTESDESLPIIPGYQITGVLGRGGMGSVYAGIHEQFRRPVAIKVLPESSRVNPDLLARFHREMEAIGRLDHPNIVQAFDAAEHDGIHYLVMERVEGSNLSEIAGRVGQLRISDACEIVRQAALGLQHSHEHGLVHRDIKPSNLMIGIDGTLKVLDLGLARLANDEPGQTELTSTGQIMGTIDYMAPEQAAGKRELDITVDIYSLGATLYRLLAGQAPFPNSQYESLLQKLNAIANTKPESVSSIRCDLPKSLTKIVTRLMNKTSSKRYAQPLEVAEALKPFCQDSDLRLLLQRSSKQSPHTGTLVGEDTTRQQADMHSTLALASSDQTAKSSSTSSRFVPARWTGFAILLAAPVFVFIFYGRTSKNEIESKETIDLKHSSSVIDLQPPKPKPIWITPVTVSSSTSGSDPFLPTHLIDSSGLAPQVEGESLEYLLHDPSHGQNIWATVAPGPDYFDHLPEPTLLFGLRERYSLTHLVIWGLDFSAPNNNEPKTMSIAFMIDNGQMNTGRTIVHHQRSGRQAEVIDLGGTFDADTVRITILDNHFGTTGALGGDRVGFGEMRFLGFPSHHAAPSVLDEIDSNSPAFQLVSDDWQWTTPMKLGPAINTSAFEWAPVISSDGKLLSFNRSGNIYLATRISINETFLSAKAMDAPINSEDSIEDRATFSQDMLSIYFDSSRKNSGPRLDNSVWFATRDHQNDRFSDPVELWPMDKDTWLRTCSPSMSTDGLKLYLALAGDLAVSTRASQSDSFSYPKVLKGDVNSNAWECHPTEIDDGAAIIFRSDRDGGFGDSDLWLTVRKRDRTYSHAINLGPAINTPFLESGPSYCAAEEAIYFRRDSTESLGDIWFSRRVRRSPE